MKVLIISFLILFITSSCSTNVVDSQGVKEKQFATEFSFLIAQKNDITLNENDNYFIVRYNDEDFYKKMENVYILFFFHQNELSIQAFHNEKEFQEIKVNPDLYSQLLNENVSKYKSQNFKKFTTEDGSEISVNNTVITEYYFNYLGNRFYKEIREFDYSTFEKMKNINSEYNLSLSLLEFDTFVKQGLFYYFEKIDE
ncbi:hypothetical protein [Moheibacter sp.]|jgi:hypothetical protein|uniref:hypothetical protein n=1 Tax=Moheibacter sp. TaxID=1965316 RepID=UPI00169F975B|nr:hypothetical protein [Flavobacteriaceae bacterium]